MTLRRMLLAALVIAPLTVSPTPITAQARGHDRAAQATEHARTVMGGKQAAKAPKAVPAGVSRVFGNGPFVPPGMTWTRGLGGGGDETGGGDGGDGDNGDGGDGEVCEWVLVYVNGIPMLEDCNGNRVPIGG